MFHQLCGLLNQTSKFRKTLKSRGILMENGEDEIKYLMRVSLKYNLMSSKESSEEEEDQIKNVLRTSNKKHAA